MKIRTLALLVACCFFVSGAAGLLYEVVWMRLLGLLFGHTVYAVTTVLAAYMGGLALGSVVFGRWADRARRPLRTYALLEAGIGLYCLLTPFLFRAADAAYLSLHRALAPSPVLATGIQLAFSVLLLVAPTTLMGATLPLLSRALVDRGGITGSRVGALYAVNTWGAVAGTAATGFLLLPTIGLKATVALGVGLNLLVAAVALALDARLGRSEPVPSPAAVDPAPSTATGGGDVAPDRRAARVALGAIAVAGAASMAYEVAWTRALSLVLGSSVYAFSVMLATFLSGLALGAFVVSRALRRWSLGLGAFAVVECTVAFVALALLPAFGFLPELFLRLLWTFGLRHEGALLAQFTASFLVMIVPTLLIGATFPLVIAAIARDLKRVGRDVGTVYGANTIGTILGSVGAGFVLIPLAGIQNGIVIAAAVNLAAGLAVLAVLPGRRRTLAIAAPALTALFAALVLALPQWDQKLMSSGVAVYAQRYLGADGSSATLRRELGGRDVVFYDEGLNATVSVMRTGGTLALTIDGKLDGGNGADMRTQILFGHLPAFLYPDAKRTLVIGLGTGMTAGALAQHPVELVEVAELEPAMIEAAGFFFEENHRVLEDPRVRIIAGDGRHVLAASTVPYDIIVSEPSNPWIAGIANLFTREFYAEARNHLSQSGIFIQWLQGYSIYDREMRMVVRTFLESFPHVSVWKVGRSDYLLVGSPQEAVLDIPRIARRLQESPGARADMARLGLDPEDVPGLFLLSQEDARRFAEGAPLNTDDLPLLEFAAPRALYAATAAEDNERLIRSYQRTRWPKLRGADALASPEAVLARIRRQWLEGRFAAARTLLDGTSADSASTPALRAERARLLFALGRPNDAATELDALDKAGALDRSLAPWVGAARAIRESNTGLSLIHKLANLGATTPAATYEAFANALLQVAAESGARGILPLVVDQLEAAISEDPSASSALGLSALVYLELGRAPEALRNAQRAVSLQPEDPQARFALGGAHELAGRPAEALRAYEKATQLAPGWPAPAEKLAALRSKGTGRQ